MKKAEQMIDKALGHGDYAPPQKCKHGVDKGATCDACANELLSAEKADLETTADTTAIVVSPDMMVASPLAPLRNGAVGIRRMATSLDPKDERAGVEAYRAQQDKDVAGAAWIGQTVEFVNWLMHDYVGVNSVTGELEDRIRTVLIATDGRRYGFSSTGVANSVAAIHAFVRKAPWKPPLKLKLVSKPLSGGKSYFILDLVV